MTVMLMLMVMTMTMTPMMSWNKLIEIHFKLNQRGIMNVAFSHPLTQSISSLISSNQYLIK